MDVSARKPLIKAIALAYCQEKGEAAAAGGAPAGLGLRRQFMDPTCFLWNAEAHAALHGTSAACAMG